VIPQSFIQDLLNRVDIVEVVGRHVQLKKGGANLMGLCPFHNEKSPSFTVSPTKQFYHCFGCGAHGTAIGFLIEHSGMGFVEAVKELAQNVGMTVPEEDRLPPAQRAAQQAKSMALSEAMQRAVDFYRSQLRTAEPAIGYLKRRGLTGEIAARFALGYAPDQWDGLRAAYTDYQDPVLVEAGLVISKSEEEGGQRKRYDRFRDRIMFPIRNTKGQTIAFGGRVMDSGEPKYLNSPETPLFQKGNELYGLFEARQAIRDAGYVLVTEGYMDVVALAQLGFPQAVATLGTACTSTHVQKMLRQTDQIIFSFDGDTAGQRAARRALEACLPYMADDKMIRFLFLPPEHDPDSYVREHGADAFAQQIKDAVPLSQFLLSEVASGKEMHTLEGRARMQHDAKPLLQAMPPSAIRMQLVHSLARLAQATPAEIESSFTLKKPVSQVRAPPPRNKRPPPLGLERQVIKLLIAYPPLTAEIDDEALDAIEQSAPDAAALIRMLLDVTKFMASLASFAGLADQLSELDPVFESMIAEVASEAEQDIEVVRLELAGALRQTKMKQLKSALDALAAAGIRTDQDRALYRELMNRQETLRRASDEEMKRR
jgi:DNA primase